MLPRFLPLRLLLPSFLSLNIPAGVLADMGEPTMDGLARADVGLNEEGVLDGPSLGVLQIGRAHV